MSIRLHFVVEGQSEETFINRVLRDHLSQFNVWADARCVYTSRQGPYWIRGGMTRYVRARRDIELWLKQDRDSGVRLTTMFDLYRLPADFPGMTDSANQGTAQARVERLEAAFAADLKDSRFIPYIQVHEFEALIFADVSRLSVPYPGPSRRAALDELERQGMEHANPETIDLEAPPSKRIREQIPDYEKVSAGILAIEAIGLTRIRKVCTHFHDWLTRLENLEMQSDASEP
jgi:hypothetical protein